MRTIVFLLIALSVSTSQDKKDPKKDSPGRVLYAVPLVAKPGEKQKLSLRGKGLDTAKDVKVNGAEGAKIKFLAAKKVAVPNNYPVERIGDSEIEIELELPKNAKPGEVILSASGPNGDSEPYKLLIRDDLPVIAEKEENGGFDTAQAVTLPCAIEGTIKTEKDVDVFRIEGKKGDVLKIEVQASRFGSPVDALVTLHDTDRKLIAAADDSGKSADPILSVTLPRDGNYFLSLIDAHDLGGPNFGYRLVIRK